MPRLLLVVAALIGLLLAAPSASAQSPAALAAAQAAPAADAAAPGDALAPLLRVLQDETARRRLVEALAQATPGAPPVTAADEPRAIDAASELGTSVLSSLSEAIETLSDRLGRAGQALAAAPATVLAAARDLADPAAQTRLAEVIVKLLLILAAGLIAEFVAKLLLRAPLRRLEDKATDGWVNRVAFLLMRTVLDLVPIAVFAAASYGALPFTEPRPVTRLVALTIINANVLSRALAAIGRLVFVPSSSSLRLLPIGDEGAHYGYIWLRRLSVVAIYGFFIAEAARLLGLVKPLHVLFMQGVGLLLAAMLVVLVLQLRTSVAAWIRGAGANGQGVAGLRGRLGDVWHVLAITYIAAVYLIWTLEIPGGFEYLARASLLSLVVLFGARLGFRVVEAGVRHGFRLNADVSAAMPLLERRANRYLPVLSRILKGAVVVVAVMALMEVWGAEPFEWLASPLGRVLVANLLSIVLILVGALLFWEVASVFIERALRNAADGPGSQRVKTLLPLLQNALRIVLIVMVTLVLLSEVGIDIGPLLAGAGVVGLAIGFGAQTLVKDVITGFFILVEDTLSVGDVVGLGSHTGVVERISIRTIHLRDLDGIVHTLPFSEVTSIMNYGKDFSQCVIEVGVAYRENVDEVIAIMREVAEGMRADPAFQSKILGELEVFGLERFDDSAVVVRIRMKTRPLQQWAIRREYNRRIKAAFDAAGIEIPFPHTTLYFGVDRDGKAPPLHLHRDPPEPRQVAAADTGAPAAAPDSTDPAGA